MLLARGGARQCTGNLASEESDKRRSVAVGREIPEHDRSVAPHVNATLEQGLVTAGIHGPSGAAVVVSECARRVESL
jgi:hypothetical protein